MKKLFIKLTLCLSLFIMPLIPARADVMPYYTSSINTNSIGVYQASNNIKIYKEPNEKSPLLLDVNWDNKTYTNACVSASNLFIVFLPARDLAFLTVVDETDDWVQVSYNKNGIQQGWIKKDDDYKFMPWRTFYNMYGRKYGLYYLKDAPECTKSIYSSNAEGSQLLGTVTFPQVVKLTSVKGNWMLTTIFDVDRTQKIGWIQWRNTSGEIYLFPAIK